VARLYRDMHAEAQDALATADQAGGAVDYQFSADMRFAGQYHELRVELPAGEPGPESIEGVTSAFHASYSEVYGRIPPGLKVEVLNWHLTAVAPGAPFTLTPQPVRNIDITTALKGEREVYFREPEPGYRSVPVYDRYQFVPRMTATGPCIVEEPESTIVVPPGCSVQVDEYLNVVVGL
jgi:N-methylhydantoinase A/oxoprolinase/acetone carboxylase beta subunit